MKSTPRFTPCLNGVLTWLLIVLMTAVASSAVFAQQVTPEPSQEVADTIRVKTRVVFLDALVKDKRTGVPISDLKPENFEVLDDGNARAMSGRADQQRGHIFAVS